MAEIRPKDLSLLNDEDVNYSLFRCCGDEDLVFLRCQDCGHIWVECFECSTWFTDLTQLDIRQHCFLTSDEQKLACPSCGREFADSQYLDDDNCDRYLATRSQVVDAGFTKFLSAEQQKLVKAVERNPGTAPDKTYATGYPERKWIVYSAAFGASIWLFGIGLKLVSQGQVLDAFAPFCSGIIVLLVGGWIWRERCRGRVIDLFTMLQSILGCSAVFGFIALFFLRIRRSLETVIDPLSRFPEWVNFLGPFILLSMMAVLCVPVFRNRFTRERL